MDKKHQLNLTYIAIAFGLLLLFQFYWVSYTQVEFIPYSRFQQLLKDKEVTKVVVGPNQIRGSSRTRRTARNISPPRASILRSPTSLRSTASISAAARGQSLLRDILSWVLPVLIFFGIWAFFIRRIADKQGLGGLMSVGRSRANIYVEKVTGVTFDDVAGVDEAKDELKEVVNFLKDPETYGRLGARVPKGILLVGPPGTGKTLLARAVAGEAGVPFFSISGSEFVEMFVGVGAARVRDLFEQARKAAPCIIFIDELDASAARAPARFRRGNDEKEQTLNQLLAELDGFDPREGIVLLGRDQPPRNSRSRRCCAQAASTGRSALDRPDKRARSRSSRCISARCKPRRRCRSRPDRRDHARLHRRRSRQPGQRGCAIATRRRREQVTHGRLHARRRAHRRRDRKEAPHSQPGRAAKSSPITRWAMRWWLRALPGVDPVHKVSIIPRGIGALGYTMQRPTEDRFLIAAPELDNRMAVLMGGRAAEELIFGEISTGAADDLDRATDIARQMVTRFGMVGRPRPARLRASASGLSRRGHDRDAPEGLFRRDESRDRRGRPQACRGRL